MDNVKRVILLVLAIAAVYGVMRLVDAVLANG